MAASATVQETVQALAHEKIWVDKSVYDKAECLYHEKLAKVLPQKIMDENSTVRNTSASNGLQTLANNNATTKKVKKVKLNTQENGVSEVTKNTKNSKKNNKKKEESASENVKPIETADNLSLKNEDCQIIVTPIDSKKYKAKEAKEKKNKADKKHRNLEDDKNNSQGTKEQLPNQGSQQSVCSLPAGGSLANEVAKARQHIKQSLQCMDGIAALAGVSDKDLASRVVSLESENKELRNIVQELKKFVTKLDKRVKETDLRLIGVEQTQLHSLQKIPNLCICPPKPKSEDEDENDDVDLFGSDSEGEDAEAAKIREERLAAYAAKKSKKPALIAKSNIILDIKPWDDETDMKAMEAEVRKIKTDGLLWGAAKLVPVAFKILKLQISCVVEDEKVSVDWLTEQIQEIEDYVQSVDIAAFNKV